MITENRLSEDELDSVSGGMQAEQDVRVQSSLADAASDTCLCPECGKKSTYEVLSGGRRKCNACGRVYELSLGTINSRTEFEA